MVERLRAQWHGGMSFEKIVEVRDEVDAMLQRIRAEGQIHSPILRCQQCGHVSPSAEPHVSVRALILSLGRFGIAPAEQAHTLEKGWAAQRKPQGLDLYGKRLSSPCTEIHRCVHQ